MFIISASATSGSSSLRADLDIASDTYRDEVTRHVSATLVYKESVNSGSLATGSTERVSVASDGSRGTKDFGFHQFRLTDGMLHLRHMLVT